MNKILLKSALAIFMLVLVVSAFACNQKEGTAGTTEPAASQSTASESILIPEKPAAEKTAPAIASAPAQTLPPTRQSVWTVLP